MTGAGGALVGGGEGFNDLLTVGADGRELETVFLLCRQDRVPLVPERRDDSEQTAETGLHQKQHYKLHKCNERDSPKDFASS